MTRESSSAGTSLARPGPRRASTRLLVPSAAADPAHYNPDDLIDRLRSKISVQPNGCWHWVAGLNADGYAQVYNPGGSRLAHRMVYEFFVGRIPDGLQIDHLCRVRRCVNPSHLETVTPRENVLRGFSTAGIRARSTHCSNGHPFDEDNTYRPPGSPNVRLCVTCRHEVEARRDRRGRTNSKTSPVLLRGMEAHVETRLAWSPRDSVRLLDLSPVAAINGAAGSAVLQMGTEAFAIVVGAARGASVLSTLTRGGQT